MLRNSKFKKEVGFIRSYSSKGLSHIKNPQPNDSEQFSSFDYGKDQQERHDSDGQFSPYKQPKLQASGARESLTKLKELPKENRSLEKLRYPPKSTGKNGNKYDSQNGWKQQNKHSIKYQQPDHRILSPKDQKLKSEEVISFSNEKLRMQYKVPQSSKPNCSVSFTLQEVNRICDRISKIKSDYQFDSNYELTKKQSIPVSQQHSGRFQQLPTSPYEKMLEKEKRIRSPQKIEYEQEFSLGKDESLNISPIQNKHGTPREAQISMAFNFQDQIPHRCNQPRFQSGSIDDESSISQQDVDKYIDKHINRQRPVGKIKKRSAHFKQQENENEDLVMQYRTCDFKHKGVKQQILQMNSNQKYYQSRNTAGKIRTQEGLREARGGICFELDTKEFIPQPAEQSIHNMVLMDDSYQYLRTKNRRPPPQQLQKPVKKKKVNMKEELLKRRQNARNYDQMARNRLFRGY